MGTRWNEPYGSIRLIGIDAPERIQSTFGSTATRAPKRLVPVGSVVKTEMDVEPRDRYGRVPGYVWFEDELVNW
ncbi:MAG: thermonuclease family protein, partial [Gemmatimonadota bacterium]